MHSDYDFLEAMDVHFHVQSNDVGIRTAMKYKGVAPYCRNHILTRMSNENLHPADRINHFGGNWDNLGYLELLEVQGDQQGCCQLSQTKYWF